MTKALVINKTSDQGLIEVLKFLLENNRVKGVFTLKKINKDGDVSYSLITNSHDLKDSVPFYPLMPVNAAKILSRFTLKGPSNVPIVAVLKPCELRAFIELVKREQGSLENLFFISSTCAGVFPLEMGKERSIEKNLSKYFEKIKKLEILDDLRPVCRSCEEFVPYNADMTVKLIGENIDKKSIIFLNTKKAEKLVKGIKLDISENELDKKTLDDFRSKRTEEKKKIFADIDNKTNGIDGLIDLFGRCIGCHACREACPICYCKLCEFDSSDCEYKPSNYEIELRKRGGLRTPPGTLYYHLGRLDHVSISCTGCGACEDVCPVDIPLSAIFKKVGESVQNMLEYTPGKDVEEDLPFTTFEKEELKEFEE